MKTIAGIILALCCFAFAFFRLWHLTDSCLWFDEIFSVHAAEHSWNSLLSFVALDLIHPPLFYVLLKIWIGLFGEGLFWLRLLPVFFSLAAIFPFVALCRELKLSVWTQILALFLFAVNGSLIKYAQEVRMYSPLLCISLFSMWLFARYYVKGKSLVALIFVNVLLVYIHYFGWLVIGAEVVAILAFQRIKLRAILTMVGIAAVSFLPWAVAVIQASKTGSGLGQNIGWIKRPGLLASIQFAFNIVEPFYYQASSIDPISIFRVTLPLLVIVAVALIFCFTHWKTDYEYRSVRLLLCFAALPMTVAFAVSRFSPYSIWGTRHLIVVFAPLLILFAVAIGKISLPILRTAGVTLVLLLSGYAFFLSSSAQAGEYSWCQCEPVASQAANIGRGNLYVFEDLVAYPVWYGAKHDAAGPRNVIKVTDLDEIQEDKSYFLPRGFDEIKTVHIADIPDPKLFIVFRARQLDEREQPLRAFLVGGYRIVDKQVYEAKDGQVFMFYLEK